MIRKFALGLVAAATLGAAAFAPTAASAFTVKVGPGHPHSHPQHQHVSSSLLIGAPVAPVAPGCFEKRRVPTKTGLRWRTVNVCLF